MQLLESQLQFENLGIFEVDVVVEVARNRQIRPTGIEFAHSVRSIPSLE